MCSVNMLFVFGQSPNLRVAVCEVLGEVLVRVLSGDKLDDSARASRDRFLETLQEHIHDAHSHVRARVLQVYARIVNGKVCRLFFPFSLQQKIKGFIFGCSMI